MARDAGGSPIRRRSTIARVADPDDRVGRATHDRILILDFGSQVTQLIARRLRETHVYCEIHPYDVGDDFVRAFAPKGIILSGSHASVYDEGAGHAPDAVWTLGVPVLGICYGMQTMAHQLGGSVELGNVREFGYAQMRARGPLARCSATSRTAATPRATACSTCG